MKIIMIITWVLMLSPVQSDVAAFTAPSAGDQIKTCTENAPGSTIICKVALSSSTGFTVMIKTQDPPYPPFQLVSDNRLGWTLNSPASVKIDRETTRNFTFVFNATDGAITFSSVTLTVIITDENDNFPHFTNAFYTHTIYDTESPDRGLLVIQATDEDLSPNITYSIIGGNEGNKFSIDPNTGQLNLTTPNNLNATTTPTYNLTVQAGDGTNVNYTTVIIHVVDDLCSPSPCDNNGTCSRNHTNYTCTCAAGWLGDNCKTEYVADPCLSTPCSNGTTCKRSGTNYTCDGSRVGLKNDSELADSCSSYPCKNGGMCALNGTAFTCSCTSDFHGSNCNLTDPTTSKSQGDSCIAEPCTNGGTCIVVGTSFGCLCVSGMTGYTCSTIVATPVSQTDAHDIESNTDSSSNLLALYIVVPVLTTGMVVASIVIYKYKKRQKVADGDVREGPRNQCFKSSDVPNNGLIRHNGPQFPPVNKSNKIFLTTQLSTINYAK
ncbi:neurogenic locus notch homolog protein 1-like isoform X2 [Dreissena polymorpha]|uniref:neurogenic locus notch homolog protein 1-like isoform X2 n=1 Tax=Dreissena polymorpha TaxID=45954 RepID=UPI002264F67F|nr:neurogenic locus notch homolog protein 1-like isoform X2 [Dreissena polymorpha]